MKRYAILTLALAWALACLTAQLASAQDGNTLVVDDDLQCKHAKFATIQEGIDAASAGDTVKVCAGHYEESVNVNKKVSVVGTGPDKIRNRSLNPDKESVVDPPSGSGFTLNANGAKVSRFSVTGGEPGITFAEATKAAKASANFITANTFGVYLNGGEGGSGNENVVAKNRIEANNEPGSASGNGVYSDQGINNADILNNSFTGHKNASIILVGAEQSRIRIVGNRITNDASIILANVVNSLISKNKSTGSNGSGIFSGGGLQGTEISGNTLRNGAFTGINLRFLPGDYPVTDSNSGNRIRENTISGFGDGGLRLREKSIQNGVRDNKVYNNGGDGGQNGISMETDSVDNNIINNTAKGNSAFDCNDDTTGNGTAGTGNTWRGNIGPLDDPDGICRDNT